MPRDRNGTCAECGKPIWVGPKSLPQGAATCQDCRRGGIPRTITDHTLCPCGAPRPQVMGRIYCYDCSKRMTRERKRKARLDPNVKVARSGPQWKRLAELVYQYGNANNTPCWRCGGPIDYGAPRASHPWSYTTGHIQEVADGGDPLDPNNVSPEHFRCNSSAGARFSNRKRRGVPPLAPIKSSRAW